MLPSLKDNFISRALAESRKIQEEEQRRAAATAAFTRARSELAIDCLAKYGPVQERLHSFLTQGFGFDPMIIQDVRSTKQAYSLSAWMSGCEDFYEDACSNNPDKRAVAETDFIEFGVTSQSLEHLNVRQSLIRIRLDMRGVATLYDSHAFNAYRIKLDGGDPGAPPKPRTKDDRGYYIPETSYHNLADANEFFDKVKNVLEEYGYAALINARVQMSEKCGVFGRAADRILGPFPPAAPSNDMF